MTHAKTIEELLVQVQHQIEMEKAWWRNMVGLVSETDQQLAIIAPKRDATADDLRSLGKILTSWIVEFPQARHIWGLVDLMEGRQPRTPPTYLMIPYFLNNFAESYEPIALVYVAQGTDMEAATRILSEQLNSFQSKLATFEHPNSYCYSRR